MTELDATSILEALDEDQQLAAKALRGPVAIIAGPGSGKTRTVSHRIAYGIATDVYSPQRVLALTYTNRAAAELRFRLRQLGASVQVRTFHSAALSQLQYFWPQVTGYSAPKLLTSKGSLLQQAVEELRIPSAAFNLAEVIAEIEYLSYSQRNLEEFDSKALPGRFSDLVIRYRELKAERRLVDWEDTLLLCTGMLRNEPRVMAQFEQQYRHFTVDEYQDISPLQQGLLETWLGNREDVCVVGDPRQTIYSFSGASSDFLTGFASRFDTAEVFELNRNYRSAKEIVDVANTVLPQSPLIAISQSPGAVSFVNPANQSAEAEEICAQVSKSTAELAEIAILARTNSQLAAFEQQLDRLGLRFQVRGQGRFFAKPEIRQAMLAIRALSASEFCGDLFTQLTAILRPLGWSAGPNKSEVAMDLDWFMHVFEELGSPGLEEYLRELDERERSGHEPVQQAITLATVHGTKGLEWLEVFLVGLNDQLFPISHARKPEEIAEERRLFYVAVTRAKRKLVLSSPANRNPSEFVTELSGSRS